MSHDTEMEHLRLIVAGLVADGFRATLEYPCFIAVRCAEGAELAMGFVNGPLGWNLIDATGRCTEGDESKLRPGSSTGDLYAFAYAACCKYAERTV